MIVRTVREAEKTVSPVGGGEEEERGSWGDVGLT